MLPIYVGFGIGAILILLQELTPNLYNFLKTLVIIIVAIACIPLIVIAKLLKTMN